LQAAVVAPVLRDPPVCRADRVVELLVWQQVAVTAQGNPELNLLPVLAVLAHVELVVQV
jgi:hypothetical protein